MTSEGFSGDGPPRIKVCGVRTDEEIRAAVAVGVHQLGLNFVPSSKRYVNPSVAARLVRSAPGKVEWIGVVADLEIDALVQLQAEVGLNGIQLHGSESPEFLTALTGALSSTAVCAYKAVRISSSEDVSVAATFPGPRILVDAKVDGTLGGTGHSFDWKLVIALSQERPLMLAGGLRPDNVADAVRLVKPWGVDVASGVDGVDGYKDPDKLRAFIRNAGRGRTG